MAIFLYQPRISSVAAVQWTGSNNSDVNNILGANHFYIDDDGGVVVVDRRSTDQRLQVKALVGEWLVRMPSGMISMTDALFNASYYKKHVMVADGGSIALVSPIIRFVKLP